MRTQELSYWIIERENIRLRKRIAFAMPTWKYGWHDDPVMGNVRYCNVRREDDKVTKWLAENWRPQYHEVWQILLARLINNIPTLDHLKDVIAIEDNTCLESIKKELKNLRKEGPIFGNAYLVSTNGISMDKVDYIIDRVLKPARGEAFLQHAHFSGTLVSACQVLCQLNGVSTFMAGQIIADLKNTEGHPLQAAPDWHTWAAPGPGSLRGLQAFYGATVSPCSFTVALGDCWAATKPLLPQYLHDMHMQDFQNCMCEFSKYMRVKNGGRARNRYNAG